MASLERMQAPASGLAYALEQTPRLSAQNPLSLKSLDKATARSEQQKAIASLLNHHDDSIFAYLRFARSLDQNFTGHGSLSNNQVLAVQALSHYDDDEIRTWLGQSRKISSPSSEPQPSQFSPGDGLQEPGFPYLSPSAQVRDILPMTDKDSFFCTPPKVVQIEGSYPSALNASGAHAYLTLHETKPSRETTKAANHYWCTICENAKSYKILSDWKKHERGHVRTYVCMYRGPLEETEGGHNCILCGLINPSKAHLDGHKVDTCGQGVPGSFANKRRARLVFHLMECHNVQGKAQAQAIADKWQANTQEQAWSCGFCAHLVYNFEERLKHIALHFDHGQTLDDWDATMVMEGLLSQRSMDSAWKRQLAASSLDLLCSGIKWEKHLIKDIQRALEMGPSDSKRAEVLAKKAYDIGEKPSAFAPVHGLKRPSAVAPSGDNQSIMEWNSMPNANHALSQCVVNPAETLQYDVFALEKILETSSNHATFLTSSSDGGSNAIERSRLPNPDQTWTFAADQYTGFNGYRGHSYAATGSCSGPTPPIFSDEPDLDEMWE